MLLLLLVWHLATMKDCLWLRWISRYDPKGDTTRQYKSKPNDSSYWSKILQAKDMMVSGFNTEAGAWPQTPNCYYSDGSGYNWLRKKGQPVSQFKLVWQKQRIPGCAFIFLLVMQADSQHK